MLYWIKLRIIRLREQKKLDSINAKLFKKIAAYIQNSNLEYPEKEEALHQIMDILLQAQSEQKSTDIIIGDYETFCKSIIEEYTKDKSPLYTGLHYFQRSIINMLFILVPAVAFFKIFLPKLNAGINILLLTFSIGYAFILMPFTHNSKQKAWSTTIYLIAMILAGHFFTMTQWGETIDSILVGKTNVILLGIILIAAVIEIYKKYKTIKCTKI